MKFFNSRKRLEKRVQELPETNNETFEQTKQRFSEINKRLAITQYTKIIVISLLYISVASAIASNISGSLQELITPFVLLANIFGIGILTIAYFFVDLLSDALLTELLAEYAELIALTHKQ
ncbi:MAG: hypothetical protein ACMXYD_02340 [Candidatus Woesearchaeota archaeon]